jgi:hypothetical protein
MEVPGPGPDRRPLDKAAARRWWPGPRIGRWPDAVQMAVPVVAAALLTACGAGLAVVVDAHGGGSWEAPVVFGVGVITVLFYGWAIFSSVHPLPRSLHRTTSEPERSGPQETEPGGERFEGHPPEPR